jgi:hypothetical protein
MSVSEEIGKKIKGLKRGTPFRSSKFLKLGSRAAVDQALWRLVKAGEITRIKSGVFVKPEKNAYVGEVLPGPAEIAKYLARQSGNKIETSGAEAARRFGFTTQMPSQAVFLTNGPGQKYHLGNLEVQLKHVAARKVALAGRPAGEALSALWYLGKDEVTPATFAQIEERLPASEFSALTSKQEIMPGWMRDKLNEYRGTQNVDR